MERRTFVKLGLAASTLALARPAFALKYYPQPSSKKWAILYGTWCGTSRDAAVWISEGMGGIADCFDIREAPDLKAFDHIILGSSIRSFTIHPDVLKYITDNKAWLKDKVRGCFAACNNMGNPPGPQQKTNYIDNIFAKTLGTTELPGKVFHGRITKSLLDPQALNTMRSMQDNDNLKRAECMAFGKEIVAGVKA